MLFSYQYINHDFEKLHEFFKHTVLKVWCKPNGDFDIDLLHVDFRQIVEKMRVRLFKPIREIYIICGFLSAEQLDIISNAFHVNNSIPDLCNATQDAVLYDDISKISKFLAKKLKEFCYSLYEYVARKATFCKRHKSIDEFYKDFVAQNSKGKCPFCGLVDLKSQMRTCRDAFDHYLPKNDFPFNTVNLQNLAHLPATTVIPTARERMCQFGML